MSSDICLIFVDICLDDISAFYLADEIRGMMRGMMVAISEERWQRQFGGFTDCQMASVVIDLAGHVNLKYFHKQRRGPKKPPPKRTKY